MDALGLDASSARRWLSDDRPRRVARARRRADASAKRDAPRCVYTVARVVERGSVTRASSSRRDETRRDETRRDEWRPNCRKVNNRPGRPGTPGTEARACDDKYTRYNSLRLRQRSLVLLGRRVFQYLFVQLGFLAIRVHRRVERAKQLLAKELEVFILEFLRTLLPT